MAVPLEPLEELLEDELLEAVDKLSVDAVSAVLALEAVEAALELECSLVGQAAAAEMAVRASAMDWHFMLTSEWIFYHKKKKPRLVQKRMDRAI